MNHASPAPSHTHPLRVLDALEVEYSHGLESGEPLAVLEVHLLVLASHEQFDRVVHLEEVVPRGGVSARHVRNLLQGIF